MTTKNFLRTFLFGVAYTMGFMIAYNRPFSKDPIFAMLVVFLMSVAWAYLLDVYTSITKKNVASNQWRDLARINAESMYLLYEYVGTRVGPLDPINAETVKDIPPEVLAHRIIEAIEKRINHSNPIGGTHEL